MLEQLLIFTRGGLILWTCKELSNALKGSPIETLIKSCLLEERSADSSFNYDVGHGGGGGAYTLRWTFHNDLGVVFVAVYQRILHLLYVDDLLSAVRGQFAQIYDPKKTRYDEFDEIFRHLHKEAEARAEEMKISKQAGKNLPVLGKKAVAGSQMNKKSGKSGGDGNSQKDDGDGDENKEIVDVPLPLDKLSIPPPIVDDPQLLGSSSSNALSRSQRFVVLLSPGSFNPPTYMHLRLFELAKDALHARGYFVIGGFMSPVNDAYKKKGLLSSTHRLQMCQLACKSSSFIMVDPWEATQSSFQRTVSVLSRVHSSLIKNGFCGQESVKVMLICGSDMLESFSIPGFWIQDQVRSICRDFGIVCIRRDGKDIEKIISNDAILHENKNNIIAVDEIIPNPISSTKVRECIKRGLSVKYLLPDAVIDYIRDHTLYLQSENE